MVRLAMILLALPFFVHASPIKTKIVGGKDASFQEFPFLVSLQTKRGFHFCGGSLIKPNWVLTASHCVSDGGKFKVVAGLHNLKDRRGSEILQVKRVIMHPQYDPQTTDYDYALVELLTPSRFPPVAMNDTDFKIPPEEQAVMATIAGWGDLAEGGASPSILQKAEVPLVDEVTCNASYAGQISDRMMCAGFSAGGKDSCTGDSGGPLTVADPAGHLKLVGIVSWGDGCALPKKFGIYSKVSTAYSWIIQNAQ